MSKLWNEEQVICSIPSIIYQIANENYQYLTQACKPKSMTNVYTDILEITNHW